MLVVVTRIYFKIFINDFQLFLEKTLIKFMAEFDLNIILGFVV
jgi:hypothetical protein